MHDPFNKISAWGPWVDDQAWMVIAERKEGPSLRGMHYGKHTTCSNTTYRTMTVHLLTNLQHEMIFIGRTYVTSKIFQNEAKFILHLHTDTG
jgi:hypothetical protein